MKKSQNPKKGLPCPVDGCPKVIYRGDYCYAHYMKNWRYGTPTPNHQEFLIDLSGKRFGKLVVLKYEHGLWVSRCDCGQVVRARAGELNRDRDMKSCGCMQRARQDFVEYNGAHDRHRKDLGSAENFACVDGCGNKAKQWSYDHADPDELISSGTQTMGIAYSLKSEHYNPRCVRCHKNYDVDHINAAKLQCLAT